HLGLGCANPDEARRQLRAVCRLARVLTVPLLSVSAAPLGADFEAEAARLREWTRVATSEGVILTIETHSETITADPLGASELCRRTRGLGPTFDPSHYHIGPHGPVDYDLLFPFVRHIRLRDTGTHPDQFQVRVGQGEIEYGRVITHLDRFHYDRALTV